jgi:hypothetical protein
MTVDDLLKLTNTYIGDSSEDRLSADDRYQAVSEATSWLLEELGNEHMVDRADIKYLPSVKWYKLNQKIPYLLTAGNLRFKEDKENREDFTRVEARDLSSMPSNRHAFAIERYNGDSYMGIVIPESQKHPVKELISFSNQDSLTYTGVNATNIVKTEEFVSFDTDALLQTSTGISTTSPAINIKDFQSGGEFIFEIEIPDVSDVTSVSLLLGDDLTTDYWLGTVTQDVGGDPLANGLNIIAIPWSEFTTIGTPDPENVVAWRVLVNHDAAQPLIEGYKVSDLRVTKPVDMNFKYIFYRVGKDSAGDDLTEFTAATDVPFFGERYPQYKFAVAHKAAGTLYRSLQLIQNARSEDAEAIRSLDRYRKNFSGERDMPNSAFKVAGINLRNRRIIKRR